MPEVQSEGLVRVEHCEQRDQEISISRRGEARAAFGIVFNKVQASADTESNYVQPPEPK